MRTTQKIVVTMFTVLAACGTQDQRGQLGELSIGQIEQALTTPTGIVVIDRTGSMMTTRSNGQSRCHDALSQATESVDEFFSDKFHGTAIAVWAFNSAGTQKLTGYVGSAEAKAAIASLAAEGCTNSTPLADVMCDAIDDLSGRLSPGKMNVLFVQTDGGDNVSKRADCSGTQEEVSMTTSWRNKVMKYALTHNVMVATGFNQGSGAAARKVDPETGLPISEPPLASAGSTDLDHEGFLYMAMMTGGTYDLINDGDRRYACSYGGCPAHYYSP